MEQLLGAIGTGFGSVFGTDPVRYVLAVLCVYFAWDRHRAYQMLSDTRDRIDKMVDNAQAASIAVATALTAIKESIDRFIGKASS